MGISQGPVIRTSIELPPRNPESPEELVEELVTILDKAALRMEPSPNGRVLRGTTEVGRVTEWVPHERVALAWRQESWPTGAETETQLDVEYGEEGTRLTFQCSGIGLRDGAPAWAMTEIVAQLLRATSAAAIGDWITDRSARKPSGPASRATYRDPLYHYPDFLVILEELALTPHDYLLDVGCGGGAFLKQALRSGCRAAGVDHSPEMIAVALESNADAVSSGKLEIFPGEASALPFPDERFTCASMHGVLGFLQEPVKALREVRRVLATGGRAIIAGCDPELRGTVAAPEPMASRLQFYDDSDLHTLARNAGFTTIRVVRRNLEPFAKQVGIPEEHLPLFGMFDTRFLVVRKD